MSTGQGDPFSIDSSTGQIKTSGLVDYEDDDEYTVTVTATDSHGATNSITVTISVTDLGEPPPKMSAPSVSSVSGSTSKLLVSWTAPDTTARPSVTEYLLQYR